MLVLINHGLILGLGSGYPSHWIVLESSLRLAGTQENITEETSDNELVDIEIFSWGELKYMSEFPISRSRTLKEFCSYIYGAVVIKNFKDKA
ncbi:hypothetical protein [Rahnella woolbedingensis]|uniref:Uncharacterized protein n=1 Tax=Rahnella woolbedingensis TaxID=1510574 RepID=A0A419N1Y4_9GAMM|nr:hypothetical protein [Rahnella woolbedingensis]RJT32040.1 hypothetical protein D6C13_24620 [Rahnella woolbedingensis]